jgi:beta-1,4-mannosyl-glycoprotein beta-1,4-N-acetylglucosaminyltransferase
MYFFNNKVVFSEGSRMTEKESKSGWWHCSAVMPYKLLKKKPQHYRKTIMRTKRKGEIYKIIPNAGWHFTYLGGVQKIQEKLEAFSHTEYNNSTYKNDQNINESLKKGRDLFGRNLRFKIIDPFNEELPDTLKKERLHEHYSHHFFSE